MIYHDQSSRFSPHAQLLKHDYYNANYLQSCKLMHLYQELMQLFMLIMICKAVEMLNNSLLYMYFHFLTILKISDISQEGYL